MSVYNPRFLRKLDISFLPRNSPQYVQTGWKEWMDRVRPQLIASPTREIWTDSSISRDQVQYLVGRSFRVISLQELPNPLVPSKGGVLWIREVYLAQINPKVIFLDRTDWLSHYLQKRQLDSAEIFRKGDPIRQFQLFLMGAPE